MLGLSPGEKEPMFFNSPVELRQPNIRLLLIIFAAALLAKGPVVFNGYAVDDYAFMSGASSNEIATVISQGRFIPAAMLWGVSALGVSVNDMCFSFGLLTLFLQSAFVVSILRFVGVDTSPAAGLVGAIMIAHPYLTEILTFRMALPAYSMALLFSIIALELASRNPATWKTRSVAFCGFFAMLITYQVFVNYIAVAIIFALINWQIMRVNNNQAVTFSNVYRDRAILLTLISVLAIALFITTIKLIKIFGLTYLTGRTEFITFDKVPERIEQVLSSLIRMYWSAEPIFPQSLKVLVACLLFFSIVMIFWRFIVGRQEKNSIGNITLVFLAFVLLIPISIGVIIPFGDWWPVPRVIAHVAMIIGVIFLLADSCRAKAGNQFVKLVVFTFRTLVLFGFIMLSNQILADQQKLNQWDNMMASRIVSRLETHPNFRNVRFVHIDGGSWGFPAGLRTMQGDMNTSAFYSDQSKVPLLSAASGYKFKSADGKKAAVGKTYCADKLPWPHTESTTIDNDLAIICLKK